MSSGFIETGLSLGASQIHRALASLQEELEAIDYYHQRWDVAEDQDLKAVMAFNRNDEMEHAALLLEWLRRSMPEFEVQLRKILFTTGPLTTLPGGADATGPDGKGLGLGNTK